MIKNFDEQLISNLMRYLFIVILSSSTTNRSISCTSLLVSKPKLQIDLYGYTFITTVPRLVGQNKRFEPSHNTVYSM